jgi:type II secretory ATPase GspE/PulE/Tfp pilus assembly ATPase PilB-like protein
MSDQELAKALLAQGVLSAQQIRDAAQQRGGRRFAQVLIDNNWAPRETILAVDPHALDSAPPRSTPAANGARVMAQAPPAAASGTRLNFSRPDDASSDADVHAEIGQDDERTMDESGVIVQGEEDRIDDPNLGPIILYVNQLISIAVEMRASDMHLEPREDGLLPRYRVDGQLRPGGLIPKELMPPIISRLKVLCNLDITEQRLPQDGRFRASVGGLTFDFRVSTLPTIYGEKIVIRLLDRSSLVTDLRKLGFQGDTRDTFEEMLQRSQGMILVTGPTGSGKTTTLYAALAATRDETKNVITVEDPVEYELPGVNQTNVHPEIGLTFAAQLRSILRQDPDVILVGEIRDGDTADIAIRAALTGHLVLSTLHTNSAVAAVTRLQDMEVPAFLIASSLSGVIAQRLVRLICRDCRTPYDQTSPEYDAWRTRLNLEPGFPLFFGAGCDACKGRGTRGRLAIIELLAVERDIRRAIMNQVSSMELRDIAIKNGMRTLWQDALEKLRQGLTTPDEVARVLLGTEEGVEEIAELPIEAGSTPDAASAT